MSVDPGTMQRMLAQGLQQPQGASYGGGGAGPQMQGSTATPGGIGAQVAQKLMLMKALQAPNTPQQQATSMLPQTNAMIGNDPSMQALQQAQMQQQPMGMPPIAPPNGMPTPGVP